MPTNQFSSLHLRCELTTAAESLGYRQMTPIQQEALPSIIEGRDVLAQAKTGSGKTAAFAVGVLNKLDEQAYITQGLVICPTRELADQVATEVRRLAKVIANVKVLTVCGGKPFGSQLASLKRAPHIVVGTPGRLLKHLQKESLDVSSVQTLVLDEADRMLDMGFREDIEKIIAHTPSSKQTLLFSATYPNEIERISDSVQSNALHIRVDSSAANAAITQLFYEASRRSRVQALVALIKHHRPESTLVFCNTIELCEKVARELIKHKISALALHGDLEQFKRDQFLVRFTNGSTSVLVATDVAARGLDIKNLDAVINFELTRDPEVHVHRIGRTGRAGSAGLALSLYSSEESARVDEIEQYLGASILKKNLASLKTAPQAAPEPLMSTLLISAGRRNKIRAGDILGALTSSSELTGDCVGKITVFETVSYVALHREFAELAGKILVQGKIKGRNYRVKNLR